MLLVQTSDTQKNDSQVRNISQESPPEGAGKGRNGQKTESFTGAETSRAGGEEQTRSKPGNQAEKQRWKVRHGAENHLETNPQPALQSPKPAGRRCARYPN